MPTNKAPSRNWFDQGGRAYARFRPEYPPQLAAFLASQAPGQQLAVDVGCGNGQLTQLLAPYFGKVVGLDPSEDQIANAVPDERIDYRCAPAEQLPLPDASASLITAAQAAHWFDLPAFYAEAARVLKPGGVLALLTYSGVRINADLDPLLREFHQVTVGPYWPPERRHVENDYRDLPFPWPEIPFPAQAMTADWTLDELLGYLGTWSATRAYREQRGEDPLPALRAALLPRWGDPGRARAVRWPLPLRIGRRP